MPDPAAAPAGASEEVRYRSKAVEGGRNGRLALKMMLVGMPCMFLALVLSGGNPLVGTLGLVLPVFWMATRRVQQLECGVSSAGIRESWLGGKDAVRTRRERLHPWSSVESWIIDEDMFRDVGRRRYAEIRFHGGHRIRFRAGDGADPEERFEEFAAAFQRCLPAPAGAAAPGAPASAASAATSLPRRRRNFYQRPIGKLVAIALSLASIGLLYAGITMPQYFPDTGWWKIVVILVPGCAYMLWRSFLRD